jgi:glycosyltransferase involved in cell wall biosynthesis
MHQTWIRNAAGKDSWNDQIKRALLSRVKNAAVSQALSSDIEVAADVIGNPYDDRVFKNNPNAPRERELLYVGRLVSDKGVDVLLRALRILKQQNVSVHLTIIGRGPEENNIRVMVGKLSLDQAVTFAGEKTGEELAEIMNRHQIIVIPSSWPEPFGIVALEGIACGCSAIGSEQGGLTEAIGKCGMTFKNGDSQHLAGRLQTLLTDPELREKFRAAAPEHLERFRAQAVAQRCLTLLREVSGMIILSHPTGNANVRHAAFAFAESNLLKQFFTTINWSSDSAIDRIVPPALRETVRRRSFPKVVRRRTRSMPVREVARLIVGAMHLRLSSQLNFLSIDAISATLDRTVAAEIEKSDGCKLAYSYEDCAAATFTAAERRGIPRIYDLPIGYWRVGQRIFIEECEREPEWARTLTGLRDSNEKLARKDEELRLATRVVVASTFTRSTLTEAPHQRPVTVIPYGVPPPAATNDIVTSGRKLKILFAGSLGQRKGLAYALRAVELIGEKQCELTLLGRKAGEGCRPLDQAVRAHRWLPSLSHERVLLEMRRHDVLLFPSLFEGFGLAITEALSQGTPVITTPNGAGPDLIDDGADGFIVPIRSAEAIAEKLEVLARDRERLRAMKISAREKAQKYPWENYRRALVTLVREIMNV